MEHRLNCSLSNIKNAKSRTLLLTTDLSLCFAGAMELYQIRWSIEVMYKECKQYLRLGKAQNTDFYGQTADATMNTDNIYCTDTLQTV